MLKRIYTKKLIVCFIVIFAITLIYFIPNDNKKLKINEEVEYVNKDIKTSKIFLLDSNNYLACTDIVIKSKKVEDLAKELIEALIIDGSKQDNIPSGFKAIIPSNTKIRSLTYNDNLIKLDLTSDMMNTKKRRKNY